MTNLVNSTKVSSCRSLLLVNGLILCLCTSCNFSKQEIPEPDYNPYVLGQGTYVEAKGMVVNLDSMAPPDTIKVKGQWKEAKRLESRKLKSNYLTVSKPEYFPTAPVPLDMSQFKKPIFIPSEGVKRAITFPPGIPAQMSIKSTDNYYMGLMDIKLGLNSNWINALLEDRHGRIWIGTTAGVNLWDGSTLINLSHQDGLPEALVIDILEDSKGNIWIAYLDQGLVVWNGEEFISYTTDQGLSDHRVQCLMEDRSGKIWIGTANGLNIWDGTGFLQYYTEQGLTNPFIYDMTEDQQGAVWIGTWGGGVNIWDGKEFSRLTTKQGLSNDFISKVLPDSKGDVWLATAGGGLNKWDGRGLSYFTDIDIEGRIGIRWAIEMIEDSSGNIWIGHNTGVDIYDGKGFTTISERDGLTWTVVVSLLEDSGGRKWIGTHGGGLYILVAPDAKHYASDEALWYFSGYSDLLEDSNGDIWVLSQKLGLIPGSDPDNMHFYAILSDDVNTTLYQDSYMNLIMGSNGIKIFEKEQFSKETPKYLYYKFDITVHPEHLKIFAILEDHNRNIWLGGNLDNGLLFWDRSLKSNTDSVQFMQYSVKQGLDASKYITALLQDKQGRIWIGSATGISVWDGRKFTRFTEEHGLSSNNVRDMIMDPEGNIWIAIPGGGINVWDGQGFMRYTRQNGLPTNNIKSIRFDKIDNIWAGTDDGLIKLWIGVNDKVHFQKYNQYRGVDRSGISKTLIDQNNNLWAISQSNMDILNLQQQTEDTAKPKLAILQLQPFFDQVDWRNAKQSISNGENPVTGDQEIPLSKVKYDSVYRYSNLPVASQFPFNINHLSFQWSATYWADPTSIQYSYILEGQDQAWSPLVRENRVTYNDLRPGDYTLKVRAVAGNALWSETSSYTFSIKPPLWATWWAYVLYGLFAVGLVLALRHNEKKRFILKERARSLEEIDKAKSEFFTNISHELRTPLTLILGPLKAWQQGTYKGDRESLFIMMSQNGRRLLQLVNQLLDLSKLDQGKLKLDLQDCHINGLVGQVLANFDAACSLKNIELELHHSEDPVFSRVDEEKLRQVLNNLISNAVKFTPEGGHIKVSVNSIFIRRSSESFRREGGQSAAYSIAVRDSGIGIPKEELGHIFDRFYQVKNAHQDESEGTGIGLALAQKLVQLHNGTIEVESEPGWGSVFTVTLPLIKAGEEKASIINQKPEPDTDSIVTIEPGANGAPHTQTSHTRPTLLLAEDIVQMRQYIRSCLGEAYHYLEAANGEEGLQLAENKLPDLILCDVMMPKMDGYEFCEKIRNIEATAHIPFIFLTAKADPDSRLQGLKIGSNDYVTKPFEAEELRLKVSNHLQRMQQYRSYFSKQLAIRGDIYPVQSLDNVFLNKAIKVVEDQLDNHEFSVEQFARKAGMSQTQLYRKLMALTGQSPSVFIRSIRLKKAAQLIVQEFGNTSEIAYAVGFSNLSYFAKCFKEQFGISPSVYGKRSVRN